MPTELDSRIPVTTETRERVKSLKRGGETYDELLRRLTEEYEQQAEVPA